MRRGEQSTSAFRLVGPMLITFVTGMAISHRAEARARDSKNRAADSSSDTVRLPYSRRRSIASA